MRRTIRLSISLSLLMMAALLTMPSNTFSESPTLCGTASSSTRQSDTSGDCTAASPTHCGNCTWSSWTHYWTITWGDGSTENFNVQAHGDCTPPPTIFSNEGKCQPNFKNPTFTYSTHDNYCTLKAWTRSRTQTGTARRPVPYIKKATRILVIRSLAQAHLRTVKPQEGIGLPVRALAPIARRQPQATVGRWVILSTAVLVTRMAVRQRPDRLWIVSKVRKSGARASVGASPAKVHAI